MMRRLTPLLALLLSCSSPAAPEAEGTWGGADASLTLTRSGGALSYACGAGTVDPGWTIDASGRFTATGVHYTGGGPVPISGRPPHPAAYTGQVRGDAFVLTVTLSDLAQTLGPFRMVRGGPAVIEVCV